ncbi:acidic leucine-rich nuclear phosphoprotein 32 family member A-like [Senna tora]|uniref:Acidic leucine-rich nuclear phosphoprotein 32 family member A-like n=1 Tax=Senna tora TaxID=362788 RepID=A0A834W4S1_9FABA|nr:acidic leucine-rich nuclear phosphoprotein 32 family member A-like [Senna tora]
METPSSTRVTISHSSSNSNIVSVSNSEMSVSKSRQRNVLIDITNDSPIVGIASSGNLETPLSSVVKQRAKNTMKTPGSGEALLRGQVKTLLQKVEEEAELSKLSLESRPFLGLVNSPAALLAPTPANTPQILNLSGGSASGVVTPSPIVEEQLISEVAKYIFDGESDESEKSVLTRSLLMDFSEKSEICDSSELTSQEVGSKLEKASMEDDDASNWSMQGISNISVNNEIVDPKFEGKHTRFIYNSDDELVDVEEESASSSPNVLRLKGLPTPKGKHMRFPEEDDE